VDDPVCLFATQSAKKLEKKNGFLSGDVRPAGYYMVNLSELYSYRLIGKLTAFLQLQEFSFLKPTVASSTSAARLSLNTSRAKLVWFSLRQQFYVLILT